MSKLLSAVIALTLLSSSTTWANPLPGDKQKDVPPRKIETRVYIRKQCILSAQDANQREFLPLLAAIFVPLLIQKALGGASAALKKAGSPETLRDSGHLLTYLYKLSNIANPTPDGVTNVRSISLNPDLGCVIMVRGTFDGPDTDDQSVVAFPKDDTGPLTRKEDTDQRRIARLRQSNIKVTAIDAVYEGVIKKSDDLSALYYEARYLQINSFQGSRSSKSGRGLVVSVSMHGPGTKEGDSTLSMSLMNMGNVTPGEVRGPEKLIGMTTSWLSGIGINDAGLKAIEKIKVADNQTIGVMPVTIDGVFVETEAGNATLRFIAEVLDSAKGDLTKTLSAEILEDRDKTAATAATAAADALEKLRQEEESTYSNYLKAEAEVAALPPTPTTPAEIATRQVKEFERDRTKRLWCVKFAALQAVGQAPTGRSCP